MAPLLPPGHRIDRESLDTWLAVTALALGMVMAGTGDLESMRVLKYVRGPMEPEVSFSLDLSI